MEKTKTVDQRQLHRGMQIFDMPESKSIYISVGFIWLKDFKI